MNYKKYKLGLLFYCIEKNCNKEVKGPNRRCRSHAEKQKWDFQYKEKRIKIIKIALNKTETREKISKKTSIGLNKYYKIPENRKKHKQVMNRFEHKYKQRQISLNLWSSTQFREKQRISRNKKPNKPEKFLISWFKEIGVVFDYIGNFKFWLTNPITSQNCNPDFVNKKLKKVIEFHGSYYHTLDTIVKDVNKLKTYKENGYQCLVIFEKELKDLNRLKEKVLKFYNKLNVLKV